jgi:antitoxin component of MazEF toxin-antitoxin module
MQRHLLKTGNNVVLSLPDEVLDGLGIKEGDHVNLEFDRGERRVIITPVDPTLVAARSDPEFARQVEEFLNLFRLPLDQAVE